MTRTGRMEATESALAAAKMSKIDVDLKHQLDTLRRRLSAREAVLKLNDQQVSKAAGLSPGYISDIFRKQVRPMRANLEKVAYILECSADFLLGHTDEIEALPNQVTAPRPRPEAAPDVDEEPPVPLFFSGMPDVDGSFVVEKRARKMICRVPPVIGVEDAYALVVPDDSMAPRYIAGETVYVNPSRPVGSGGYAVVRFAENRALIRRIVRIDPVAVLVADSAGAEMSVERDRVAGVHRIVGSFSD